MKQLTSFRIRRVTMLLLFLLWLLRDFIPDDPVWKEPPPRAVEKVKEQRLNPLVDFYKNTVHKKGQRNTAKMVYPSQGVNTLDEVPDSTWYTNRHDRESPVEYRGTAPRAECRGRPGHERTISRLCPRRQKALLPDFRSKMRRGECFF